MRQYSFIDFGLKDFLRSDIDGTAIVMEFPNVQAAEDWLLTNGEQYGWQNEGVRYWCWNDEEDSDDDE